MIRYVVHILVVLALTSSLAMAVGKKVDDKDGMKKRPPANWLRGSGPSGYEKALKFQEETGIDMLVLFCRETPSSEKGLLRWFEKKGMNHSSVLKQMRKYVKVRVDATRRDKRTRALIDAYKVGKTPRLVVRHPNGWNRRVKVFDWPGGEPELASHQEIIERLKAASSPTYREGE